MFQEDVKVWGNHFIDISVVMDMEMVERSTIVSGNMTSLEQRVGETRLVVTDVNGKTLTIEEGLILLMNLLHFRLRHQIS